MGLSHPLNNHHLMVKARSLQQQLPNHQGSTVPSTSAPSQQTAPMTRPRPNRSVPAFTVLTSSALVTVYCRLHLQMCMTHITHNPHWRYEWFSTLEANAPTWQLEPEVHLVLQQRMSVWWPSSRLATEEVLLNLLEINSLGPTAQIWCHLRQQRTMTSIHIALNDGYLH